MESIDPEYDALIERLRQRSRTTEDLSDKLLLLEAADAMAALREENEVMNDAIEGVELDVQEKLLERLKASLERNAHQVPAGAYGIQLVVQVLNGLIEKIRVAKDKDL